MQTTATCLGYPRMGAARELKKAMESAWNGKGTHAALLECARSLRQRHWESMRDAGLSTVPTNDFSLYDAVLDMAVALGAVPQRYQRITDPLTRYYAMARGLQDAALGVDVQALEMTKWFDTNYHYIVPEIAVGQKFALDAGRILAEAQEARALGTKPRPVILGPVSFLMLAKRPMDAKAATPALAELGSLLPHYLQLLGQLEANGIEWVQLDEPCLTLDLQPEQQKAYREAFTALQGAKRPKLMLGTYFGQLGDNLSLALGSGYEGLHIDLVRGAEQLDAVLKQLPASMRLALGLVDGRNIWRCDLATAHQQVRRAVQALGAARTEVSTSCSLLHTPVDLDQETKLDVELRSWMAFAKQKLHEVVALAQAAEQDKPMGYAFGNSAAAQTSRRTSARIHRPEVKARMGRVTAAQGRRHAAFADRIKVQQAALSLPAFPTTTIGSFPQTTEVRQARAAWRAGKTNQQQYDAFLRETTERCIRDQEALGLDVLVHGEFERNDMVEYFGEQMDGFAFTAHGWVQSYGSRCVKPPVLFGDVARAKPMTVAWSQYAQGLTKRPVKGMLTGPVTILQWSFVRDDQPRRNTCAQIAMALRDEVQDLEKAGITLIQVDEPAIREGLPLRHAEWTAYLEWAVECFRLATAGVQDGTQIHTHMCYSEFHDILPAIVALDADVLSIETSRSKMELLDAFKKDRYPNHVGPGVYDVHAARVPDTAEMFDLLRRAAQVLPPQQLWVNPDCGLKTRGWPEVNGALKHMVEAAHAARQQLAMKHSAA